MSKEAWTNRHIIILLLTTILASLLLTFITNIIFFRAQAFQQEAGMKKISLPSARHVGEMTVEEAIFIRRSIRSFQDIEISLEDVAQLLWAAGGITYDAVSGPSRAAPSAGGLYPIEIYLVAGKVKELESGIYKYHWQEHALQLEKSGDFLKQLAKASFGQAFIAEASCSIVMTSKNKRTTGSYGQRGLNRYIPMDIGHAAENVFLQAVALKLATVPVGAFDDNAVSNILELEKKKEDPFYILPIGISAL